MRPFVQLRLAQFTILAFFLPVYGMPLLTHAQPVTAAVSSSDSRIHYYGSAFLHDWRGTSRDVNGRLFVDPETPSRSVVELHAPVASFDSGNKRRDRNMREATAASTFRTVRFRTSSIEPVSWHATPKGKSGTWSVSGELSLNGQTHPIRTEVEVRIVKDTVFAQTEFLISLKRFGITRPELLWVAPISDEVRIDAKIAAPITRSRSLAHDVTETVQPNGMRILKSSTALPVFATSYTGRGAGVTAAYRKKKTRGDSWTLSLHGTPTSTDRSETDRSEEATAANGLGEEYPMRLEVDGTFVQPLQVTTDTRRLGNGHIQDVKTGHFTRPFFEQIAQAQTVVVTVGAATFTLPYPVRRDLRLILDAVDARRSESVTQR